MAGPDCRPQRAAPAAWPALLLVVAALVATTPAHAAPSTSRTVEAFTAELDERLPRWLARDDVPGAAVAVVIDGQPAWAGGYGVADRDAGTPVTSDTVFQAGSMSKALTAWGVARLVEEGAVDLETPVEAYLSEWRLPASPYESDEVTVERLLSHTSGLPWVAGGLDPTRGHRPPEQLLAGEADTGPVGLEQPPGAGFLYSNPAYTVLELLVEDVTGDDFAAHMHAEVLDPLGMEHSAFAWDEQRLAPHVTTGYGFDGRTHQPQLESDAGRGAGGLYTTADDLARFVAASTGTEGQRPGAGVIAPETVADLHTPRIATEGVPHGWLSEAAALGHFVETLPGTGRAVSHAGEQAGWLGAFVAVPATGDGVVVLTNSRRSYHTIVEVISLWAQSRDLGPLAATTLYDRATTGIHAAIAVLGVASLWLLWRLVTGWRAGARRPAPWSHHGRPWRLLHVLVAVTLGGGWWLVARDIAATFLPAAATYLGVTISAWALLAVVAAACPGDAGHSQRGGDTRTGT